MPGNFLVDPAEAKDLPSSEVMDLNQAIRRFQDAYLDYWMATAAKTTSGRPIDVIVMPVSEAQSVRPGRMRWGGEYARRKKGCARRRTCWLT